MADKTENTTPAAPAEGQQAPAAPTPSTAAPPPKTRATKPVDDDDATATEPKPGEPNYMRERLARAKDAGKREAKKETKRERKTEKRELKRIEGEMNAKIAEASSTTAAAQLLADTILAEIPEADRDAVKKAGAGSTDNLFKALALYRQSAITARATGVAPGAPPATPPQAGMPTAQQATAAHQAAQGVVNGQQQQLPAPANTAHAPAPAPNTNTQTLSLTDQYAQIRSISDPNKRESQRAQFLLTHGDEILDAVMKRQQASP